VSRATVQAAIQALTSRGLLVQLPNCRPTVAENAQSHATISPQSRSLIAVWIQPDLQDLGAAMILQGIRSATEASGYPLLIGFPMSDRSDQEQRSEVEFLKALVNKPDVAGAIVWETCAPAFATVYPALRDVGLPIVFVDREPPEEIDADVVCTNNRRGARKAVNHLIGLGHRNIAMISNVEPASSVRDRIDGYHDALSAAGIELHSELMMEVDTDGLIGNPGLLTELIRGLLRREPKATAIFAVNDGIALGVQAALRECGVRVPEEISLVGFDWILRSLPLGGDLTTVAQPFEAIGRLAAERLLERIGSRTVDISRHILLEAPLVVRTTTGPPPTLSATSGNSIISGSNQ